MLTFWQRRSTRRWLALGLGLVLLLGIAQISFAQMKQTAAQEELPPLQAHPLPPSLAAWTADAELGDYFDAIEPTPAGYLVWSQFPIQVYIQPADNDDRSRRWSLAMQQAVAEWQSILPLNLVDSAAAQIKILRSAPPLQFQRSTERSGNHPPTLPRVRSAETRYEFFVDRPVGAPPRLAHRFTIYLSPNQTADYLTAAARHELGHALGIWGHSPNATDALYFSQVRQPPAISDRDINTLKRIYQQPTRLGWSVLPQARARQT